MKIWPRLAVLATGIATLMAQTVVSVGAGRPADPTLVTASIACMGLGLGLVLDHWRPGSGKP